MCPKGVSGIDMLNKDVRILCKSEKELGARKEFLKETFGLNEDECREVIFNNPYIVNMAKRGLGKKRLMPLNRFLEARNMSSMTTLF